MQAGRRRIAAFSIFNRAEFFFAYKHYLDAEDAYASIVKIGVGSSYYELALYKLGWTLYKTGRFDEAERAFATAVERDNPWMRCAAQVARMSSQGIPQTFSV